MKVDITITENELKQIIKEHLRNKFKSIGDIKIEVGTRTELVDPYRNEYQSYGEFRSVKCNVEV